MEVAHPEEAPLAGEQFFWRDRCAHRWVMDKTTSRIVCSNCGEHGSELTKPPVKVILPRLV